ncbi:MAG: pentapeptide repeat-containing protein [Alphaproteobacteria bacterium]|nr:pentapeptide repeat-containing protein [Alphaproteobacteria bacterium]
MLLEQLIGGRGVIWCLTRAFRHGFVGASLVGASLVGASLVGASLVGASFVGVSLD